MATTTATTGLTYDDLVALQERPEHEFQQLEIIDGELFVSPPPIPYHQILSYNFGYLFGPCVVRQRFGQLLPAAVGVHLSADDVVQPDFVFVRRERLHIIGPRRIEGVPDLVVEILSKSTRRNDLTAKKALYERYAVPEYWIIDPPRREVSVLSLVDGKYQPVPIVDGIIRSRVIPGCTISLTDLFDLQSFEQ